MYCTVQIQYQVSMIKTSSSVIYKQTLLTLDCQLAVWGLTLKVMIRFKIKQI